MAKPEDVIEMPALGRPFRLGMLYHCHRDALFPEHFLFDPDVCKQNTKQEKHTSTATGPVSCDTLDQKAAALGMKTPLLTSLLCGLFDVEGPAEYLLGTQWSRRSPGSLTYKSFTIESLERLDINAFRPEHSSCPNVQECQATHVVTAVWYGALGFYDYDNDASSSDPTKMGAKARPKEAFPSHKNQTPLETDDQEEKPHRLSSQVAHLDPTPTHPNLSKLLGEAEEHGVPVKVRLYPLAKLKFTQPLLAHPSHEISHALNHKVKEEMTILVELEADCQALLRSPAAQRFPEVGKKIQKFRERCSQSKEGARTKLAGMVPLVREGEKEEKELAEVLKQVKESTLQLCRSFSRTKQEVSLVNSIFSCLRELEDADATGLKPPPEMGCSPMADFVVAFMFTSLHGEVPSPPLQRDPLPSRGKQPSEFEGETCSGLEWYEDKAVIKRTGDLARSFLTFARANSSSQKTQFVVGSVPAKSNPGASVYLYERGELKETHFEPPSKPLPIQMDEISHDRVRLRLTPGSRGKGAVSGYQIEYRATGEEGWVPSITMEQEETFTISGLQPETEYEFCYASMSRAGLSEPSDVTNPVKTRPAPLSKPSGDAATEKKSPELFSFEIEETNPKWTKGPACKEDEIGKDGRQLSAWEGEEEEEAGAPLVLVPSALTTGGATCVPDSREWSKASLCNASRVLKKGPPLVYALPLEKVCNQKVPWIKYQFGKPDGLPSNHKVIMLLGETGAGKSMLIDGMMNYLLGVQWEDDFRFSLVQEDPRRGQVASQTDTLTVYEVHLDPGQQDPGSLTIIDTPGFGDTRGKQWDQMLLENIQELFNHPSGVRHITVIGVVVQASQPRLTQHQKYIFDLMFSIFGREIRDNVQLLITFADGKAPPVLGSLRAGDVVPCARDAQGGLVHFPFNNSALFASNIHNEDEDSFHFNRMFWEMGLRSMQTFFQSLKGLQPRSVVLSADVINKQKALEAFMALVRPRVQKALVELVLANKTCKILQNHWADLQASRDFEYWVDVIYPQKTVISDTKCRPFNCLKCKYTCQDGFQTLDKSRNKTWFFTNTPCCVVCAGQCAWKDHCYEHAKWEYLIVKERRCYSQLRMWFQRTYNKRMTANDVLGMVLHEVEQAEKQLVTLLEMASAHLQKRQKSQQEALSEYIEMLIVWEEKDSQQGFKKRQLWLRNYKERVLSNPSSSH